MKILSIIRKATGTITATEEKGKTGTIKVVIERTVMVVAITRRKDMEEIGVKGPMETDLSVLLRNEKRSILIPTIDCFIRRTRLSSEK